MHTSNELIRRDELRKKLGRARQLRAAVTLLSLLPTLLIGGAFWGESMGEGIWPCIAVFAVPLTVGWLMTRFCCRPAVICPRCGQSLWSCGTGSFKPRRMQVREEAGECPGCGIPIA